MNEVLLIAGMGLVTFATRYPVLVWLSRTNLPPTVFRALKFVAASVLSAIIFPALFLRNGELALWLNNASLSAGLIAAFVAWRSRNLLLTILIGMAAFLAWRALFPL